MNLRFRPIEELAGGDEHRVALLEPGLLIKWPRSTARVFAKGSEVITTHLSLLRSLEVSMPTTQVLESPEIILPTGVVRVPYCMITTQIQGRHLKRPDLARPEVRNDLRGVIRASKALEPKGLSLDLFGARTVVKILDPTRTLGNNLMVDDKGLYLVDPSLRVLNEGSIKELIAMRVRTSLQHALGDLLLSIN